MILRRFSESLKQQNWTAIVIEFVLLVLGVFLGIQVANWNAAQAEGRLGRAYVQQLARDLRVDQDSLTTLTAYYSVVLQSVRETDALLRAPNPDPRALVINAYRATEVRYGPQARATWDQMVSAGHVDLLPKGMAEGGLAQYYGFDTARDIYDMGLASPYRRTVRGIIPIAMQVAIQAGCSDSNTAVGFVETCEFDADPVELKEVAQALRSDPAVLANLREHYSNVANAVGNLGGTRAGVRGGIALLSAKSKAGDEARQ